MKLEMKKLSRRGMLFTAALPAAVTQLSAQQQSSREQDLDTARTAIKNNLNALAQVKVPIATEPAFTFKA